MPFPHTPDDSKVSFDFLMAEASLGLTFATIARKAPDDSARADANTLHARRAYLTVLRFRDRVVLGSEATTRLDVAVRRLRNALRELGEDL